MIDQAWIPVVAAASGAVIAFIGGLIGAGISYFNTRQQLKHQAKQEYRKFYIEKLDEIVKALDEMHVLLWKDISDAHVGDSKSSDSIIDITYAALKLQRRISFLACAYFPQLEVQVVEVTLKLTEITNSLGKVRQGKKPGEKLYLNNETFALMGEISKLCADLEYKVSHIAKHHNLGPSESKWRMRRNA